MEYHNSSQLDQEALLALKEAVYDWLSQELKTEVRGKFEKPYNEFLDYFWAQREESGIMGYSVSQYCVAIMYMLDRSDLGIKHKFFPQSIVRFINRRFGTSISDPDYKLHCRTIDIFCCFSKNNICYVTDEWNYRMISTTATMATILPWLSKKYRASEAPKYCLMHEGVGPVEELQPNKVYTLCKRPYQEEDLSKQKLE